ncbi:presqualene diphosphate synthase HpnD [Phenylobacterium sp.]|jgi:phytoene synthase|uniref:presqualene diphosphate synthase HpnD n=1 Tax=Phenylobacterium sp. TaxID=1871053 RepID=UPI002E34029D|nr:presqualene diphosphate synthase HpnD [Phenylobacterium sp.]HEX3367564.1 presqualene diphosphate synthase HpnD [Phenylobacterium sp.]
MTLTATRPDPQAAANAQAASGSSFAAGMRVLPKAEREAMYAVYGFCRIVDDIADEQVLPIAEQRVALDAWRGHVRALYADGDTGPAAMLAEPVARYGLEEADFQAVIDGMQMDLEGLRGPSMATLDLYCDRVASAVGRLSVKIFGMEDAPGRELAHHLGRALQLTNILRDVDEDADMGRLYLPDELLAEAGVASRDPAAAVADPHLEGACRTLADVAEAHYASAREVLAARPPGRLAAPRLMAAAYGGVLKGLLRRGWAPPRRRVRVNKAALLWLLAREGLFG